MRRRRSRIGAMRSIAVALGSLCVGQVVGERPLCQLAEALVGSVDAHLADWDSQITIALNETLNCSMFLEFIYLSRDRIRSEVEFLRGNFTEEERSLREQGEAMSTTSAMTYMSTASSLVSAHIHIHGVLSTARPYCLSENLQLLFLMSLKRMKTLLQNQLRHIWVVFQGTAEIFHQGAGRWLGEMVELFEADLKTFESIMVSWRDPELLNETDEVTSPGPPLPPFSSRDTDGVALSTIELLRRDAFEEWNVRKPLLRGLLRHVLPRDGHVADVCAGSGKAAEFLNDTGLLTAYAFDPSQNIRLVSKGGVDFIRIYADSVQLWRSFDIVMCLSAASDFGSLSADGWAQAWKNIDTHATRGAIISCGTGEMRRQVLGAAATNAPGLKLDETMTERLWDPSDGVDAVCIFWRDSAAQA